MALNDHDWAVVISVSDYEGATAKPPWITKLKGPDKEDAVMRRLMTSLLAPRSALEERRKAEPA